MLSAATDVNNRRAPHPLKTLTVSNNKNVARRRLHLRVFTNTSRRFAAARDSETDTKISPWLQYGSPFSLPCLSL